ncbi:hypothetical protein USDA257_c38870 [Sinorhizobium fredii USDA 257]|uniref:DUF2946 domain-containing protein n=1 Tax=Sinorhizobium fredii (strain USDA 257) TaxID=1185652 RepID=I3X976_SINF2|nr:hypothetical protein USDA257_c38870 [Sinorhizobium fredii USDA 257]
MALIAACMFVLQSVFGALAGEMPALRHVDTFGNPLCATGTSHGGPQHSGGGQDKLPECCILGCTETSWLPDAPYEGAQILTALPSRDGTIVTYADVSVRRSDRHPGSPRGPPPAA